MHYKVPVRTSRSVLTEASLSITETSLERNLLIEFKNKAASANVLEQELQSITETILLLTYLDGPFARLKRSFLQRKASRIEHKIANADKKLEKIAQAEPLQKIIARFYRQQLIEWRKQRIPHYAEYVNNAQSVNRTTSTGDNHPAKATVPTTKEYYTTKECEKLAAEWGVDIPITQKLIQYYRSIEGLNPAQFEESV